MGGIAIILFALAVKIILGEPLEVTRPNPFKIAPAGSICPNTKMTDGHLSTKDCTSYAIVETLREGRLYECGELELLVFYGPAVMEFENCHMYVTGLPLCHQGDGTGPFNEPPCIKPTTVYFHVSVALLAVVSLLNSLILRLVWIRFRHCPKGYVAMYREGSFLHFELTAVKEPMVSVKFHRKRDKPLIDLSSRQHHTFVYTRKMMLMSSFLLCCLAPLPRGHAQTPGDALTGFYSSMVGSEGETVNMNGWQMKIEEAHFTAMLVPGYLTYDCEAKMVSDWHCSSICLVDDEYCKGYGANGKVIEESVVECKEGKRCLRTVREFCAEGTTGCFAKSGCWIWRVSVTAVKESHYRVKGIFNYRPVLKVKVLRRGIGAVPFFHMPFPQNWDSKCIVIEPDGKESVCSACSLPGHPNIGTIGDIQNNGNDSLLIPRGFSSCQKDKVGGPACSVEKCGIVRMLKDCIPLDLDQSHSMFKKSNGILQVTAPLGVSISGYSLDEFDTSSLTISCGPLQKSIWVTLNSGEPATLSLSHSSGYSNQSLSWLDPCTNVTVIVPCGGYAVHQQISWPSQCYSHLKGMTLKRETKISERPDIDNVFALKPTPSSNFLKNWFGDIGFHIPALFSGIGVNFIIVIVIIFIMKR